MPCFCLIISNFAAMATFFSKTLGFTVALLVTSIFQSCDKCEADQFGDTLWLEVPVEVTPGNETLILGDTIWVHIDISKHVSEQSRGTSITLDSFNFYTELNISRIDDTIEHFPISDSDIVENKGKLTVVPLTGNAKTYHATARFSEDRYFLDVGFIPPEIGIYAFAVITSPIILQFYEHPALYKCDKRKRNDARVLYTINNGDPYENNYELFQQTSIPHVVKLDVEQYIRDAWYTFRVVD